MLRQVLQHPVLQVVMQLVAVLGFQVPTVQEKQVL